MACTLVFYKWKRAVPTVNRRFECMKRITPHLEKARRNVLFFVLMGSVAGLLASCQSSPITQDQDTTAVIGWRRTLLKHPLRTRSLHFVGITVKRTDWKHRTLAEWETSSEAIGRGLTMWFGVPPNDVWQLKNVDREDLQRFFRDRSSALKKRDTLIVYLGTHQLKNGKLLLARNQSMTGKELAAMIAQLPCHTVLLADVCYAARLEDVTDWSDRVSPRIYAADKTEEAIGFQLSATTSGLRNHFATCTAIVRASLTMEFKGCSLFGLQIIQALTQVNGDATAKDGIDFTEFATRLKESEMHLIKAFPKERLPRFVTVAPKRRPFLTSDLSKKRFHELSAMLEGDAPIRLEDALILVSRIYHPSLMVENVKKDLQTLQDELAPRVTGKPPIAAIHAMASYLHEEKAIVTIDEPFMEDFLFHRTLQTKEGRCSSLSALYVILGERLNLPLAAACLPEHVFVRWSDGDTVINVETTKNGRVVTDAEYARIRPWPKTPKADRFFMKTLTKRQIVAIYLSPLGEVMRMRGRLDLAEAALRLATSINPEDPEAWNHLGMVHSKMGKVDLAIASYRQALSIHPEFAAAWNNLGNKESAIDEKLKAYRNAVSINPKLGPTWKRLSYVWLAKGNVQMAWSCANRAIKLGVHVDHEYIRTLKKRMNTQE